MPCCIKPSTLPPKEAKNWKMPKMFQSKPSAAAIASQRGEEGTGMTLLAFMSMLS